MSQDIYLTGITTTGTPHIGNYLGAIRPGIAASRDKAKKNFYFLADLHALAKAEDPDRIARSTLEIATPAREARPEPTMLFAAGMGVGLLFWGRAELLTHFDLIVNYKNPGESVSLALHGNNDWHVSINVSRLLYASYA